MDACRICWATGHFEHHLVKEMMFGSREAFDYFACGNCGCLQIAVIPEDLSRFYPADYYSNVVDSPAKIWLKGRRLCFDLGERSWLGRWASKRYGADACAGAIRMGGISRRDPILDVGGGNGIHLRPLRAAGFSNLLGVDAYVQQEVTEPGLRIVRSELHAVPGTYRLIMMHHSFEHMTDPSGVIAAAARLLRDDGLILIRQPVLGYGWRRYGVNWVDLDAPRHLHLHTHRSMSILAARHSLEVASVTFDSTELEIWGSEQYTHGIAHRSPRSHEVDPGASMFTADQIASYRRAIHELNVRGESGRAAFVLRRSRTGAGP